MYTRATMKSIGTSNALCSDVARCAPGARSATRNLSPACHHLMIVAFRKKATESAGRGLLDSPSHKQSADKSSLTA